jgi:hypothetical protein
MRFKTRLFVTLFVAGFAGILSFLLVDLAGMVATLPISDQGDIPPITPAVKLLSLIQPTILLALAVLLGVVLAHKVGLSSPVAEAAAVCKPIGYALNSQVVPGLLGGLAGGVSIVLTGLLWTPYLRSEVVTRISGLGEFVPIITRLLYGGITEELLLRWGLMTLIVWAGWRLFQKGGNKPKPGVYIGAIVISSVVFGIGHLPIAYLLFPGATISLTLFVIVANSMFGLIAGFLFWKKGLESAMIAHMLAHVVMLTATYFGVYF